MKRNPIDILVEFMELIKTAHAAANNNSNTFDFQVQANALIDELATHSDTPHKVSQSEPELTEVEIEEVIGTPAK